ncbi:cell surface protein SprA, partial [Candidatus Zixiibacteriota bacterium]
GRSWRPAKLKLFSLGHMNVIDGSVVVTANGERLQEGLDYSVIYEIGQITLLSDKATNPNAEVTVDYDYAPFFMPAQKTLLGARAEYNLGENSRFGSTALFRSEKTLEQRPRVGQEPTKTFVWDADLALKFKPSIMSAMVNAIPLVETDQKSALNISAEVAQSLPNPNTLGKAYIDDFEGSKEALNLSVMRTTWTKSSAPLDDTGNPLPDSSGRGKLNWYNPWEQVRVQEIWPNKQTLSEESKAHVLNLEFTPDTTVGTATDDQWGGVMRYFSEGYWKQDKSKYLEVWVKGTEGVLTIDLGIISEDIDGNGVLDTEDKLRNGVRDGILDADEDTGLDGVTGADGSNVTGDDSDDDWYYSKDNRNDYRRINGTEGNGERDSEAGRRPDTEDLDKSGYLETENGYFQFRIDLSSDENLVPDTETNGWRLYRIALRDTIDAPWYREMGDPDEADWRYIKYARLWVTGLEQFALIRIASLEIVGNKWEELGVASLDTLSVVDVDEGFDLAVKNTNENDDYQSPPDVTPEKDRATNLPKREQSLVLKFSNLRPDHYGAAQRSLYSREDYTGYGALRMFVHGSEETSPGDSSKIEFYLRLGASSNDYYEYHTPVYYSSSLWDSRNEVVIDFEEITALKDALLRRLDGTEGVIPDTTQGNYRIRGRPSLSTVEWFEVGVINRSDDVITGEVWLDELLVNDVRRKPGWAGRVSVDASFADFANVSYSYRKIDSEFHGLREKTGSGMSKTRQNVRAGLKLDKFLPASWGFSLPVSGSWSTELQLPRLMPGSDIVLPPAMQQQDRTETDNKTANFSFSKRKSSGNWLTAWTLERIRADLALSKKESRSHSYPMRRAMRLPSVMISVPQNRFQ